MAGDFRLYEISAMLSCHAVILAESEEAAMKEIELWDKEAWYESGDVVGVSDVECFDVRPLAVPLEKWDDEAHGATPAAYQSIHDHESTEGE